MYKYTYKISFDSPSKINSVIGSTPVLIQPIGGVSVCFISQLDSYQKDCLDQYMTDAGYSYIGMAQGGVESSTLAVSPNGTVWKISVNDLGVITTSQV